MKYQQLGDFLGKILIVEWLSKELSSIEWLCGYKIKLSDFTRELSLVEWLYQTLSQLINSTSQLVRLTCLIWNNK